jgi:16S rRNA (cytidine1402-2'-O)-methyltransferase
MADSEETGRVVLAGAPLGQAGDASARLRDALASAPVIAAEDTRRLRRLCADLGVTPVGRVVSFFDANEAARVPALLDAVRAGQDVLVVTDAGMPSVSDPGYRLVAAAVSAGLAVTSLPGPSAVTTALAVSGLPVDRFCFEGFLPRKAGERRRALAALAGEPRTMVFFEAPHRVGAALADLADAFGPERPAAVCRELTKTYEEVRRGGLGELAQWAAGELRGEITLVVAGLPAGPVADVAPAELASAVAEAESGGASRKDAIAAVATGHGLPKRTVFDAVVAGKRTTPR